MHICKTKEELLRTLNTKGEGYGQFWTELDGDQTFVSEITGMPCLYCAYADTIGLGSVHYFYGKDGIPWNRHHSRQQTQPLRFDICGRTCHVDTEKVLIDTETYRYSKNRLGPNTKELLESTIERNKPYFVSGYFKVINGEIQLTPGKGTFFSKISDHDDFRFRSTAASQAKARVRAKRIVPIVIVIAIVLVAVWVKSLTQT